MSYFKRIIKKREIQNCGSGRKTAANFRKILIIILVTQLSTSTEEPIIWSIRVQDRLQMPGLCHLTSIPQSTFFCKFRSKSGLMS